MKIINSVLGDATGGRWKVFLDYTEVLHELGHEVLLIINSKKIPVDLNLPANVETRIIRNSGHYDVLATFAAMRTIGDFQPDVVVCHCGRSVSLMKRASFGRVPVVVVNHSNNVKRSVRADAYFNISTHIGKLIREFPQAKGKAYHIPNMVEFPADSGWSPHSWDQPARIGAFGRFDVVKGFHVFIDALAELKQRGIPFVARLGGDGVEKDALLQQASDCGLGDVLQFVGWVEDPQEFFAQTDIFCVPALSDAFGITPLEAAISCVPIIASDAEGHQDMFVDGQHALLVPRRDAIALANALEMFLADQDKAMMMARMAFDRVLLEYGREQFIEKVDSALRDIVNH